MSLDIKAGCKIHNRFDVEVEDITTGEIVRRATAENIILSQLFASGSALMSAYSSLTERECSWARQIYFGKGTGMLSSSRTSLFDQLSNRSTEIVEEVYNQPPTASYIIYKIVLLPAEFVGETITEVGLGNSYKLGLYTHALLKDSEGNSISIGPKTDTQQITIYATVYATLVLPASSVLTMPATASNNYLMRQLCGACYNIYRHFARGNNHIIVSSKKNLTNNTLEYASSSEVIPINGVAFVYSSAGVLHIARLRVESAQMNKRIWSIVFCVYRDGSGSFIHGYFRMLLPNTLFSGYNFIGESIAVADGVTTKFPLFWGDINTVKSKTFYVDGVPTACTVINHGEFTEVDLDNVSARYIRLDMKSTTHATQYQIAEVEIYDDNDMLITDITRTGSFSTPNNSQDNNIESFAYVAIGSSQYITFDLKSVKTISKIRIAASQTTALLVVDLKIGTTSNPAIHTSDLEIFNTAIEFASAPSVNSVITGDWWVDYIPKDENHVIDFSFTITFNEGA